MNDSAERTISPERLARLENAADRLEIHDCLARVARGADRADREIYLSAFHPDAMIHMPFRSSTPTESFEKGTGHLKATHHYSLHHITNHTCEIEGDVAYSETYFMFVGRNFDETNRVSFGRYFDRIERRNGEWRIAMRRASIECAGILQPKFSPVLDNLAVMGAKGEATRDKDDPSYIRG